MNAATLNTKVVGHVLITDKNTGEVLLDKNNAVHNANMALVIARGLSDYAVKGTGNSPTYSIYQLALGNGGSSVNSQNQITYLPPNVTGATAKLYNQTYFQVVDANLSGTPAANSVTAVQSTTDTTTTVIVSMSILAGQPSGQDLTDSPPDPNFNAPYAFDELALLTADSPTPLLLTHIIFSPILKTANRELAITYSLTISVS